MDRKRVFHLVVVTAAALLALKWWGEQTPSADEKKTNVTSESATPIAKSSPDDSSRPAFRAAPALSSSTGTHSMPAGSIAAEVKPKFRVPVARFMPSLEQERSEVAKDPHGTPESVLKFSLSLGERLDSLESEDEAASFIDELDECVTRPPKPNSTSSKALCLLNAKKVAGKYPALDAKAANLESRADRKIRDMVEFLD